MKERKTSNLMQGLTLLFLVVNVFLFMAIKTPPDHLKPENVLEVLEVETAAEISSAAIPANDPYLEWKLVDRYVDGEWQVEKFQEYEIYKDENGQVVEERPTDHYNYLKYWRY